MGSLLPNLTEVKYLDETIPAVIPNRCLGPGLGLSLYETPLMSWAWTRSGEVLRGPSEGGPHCTWSAGR